MQSKKRSRKSNRRSQNRRARRAPRGSVSLETVAILLCILQWVGPASDADIAPQLVALIDAIESNPDGALPNRAREDFLKLLPKACELAACAPFLQTALSLSNATDPREVVSQTYSVMRLRRFMLTTPSAAESKDLWEKVWEIVRDNSAAVRKADDCRTSYARERWRESIQRAARHDFGKLSGQMKSGVSMTADRVLQRLITRFSTSTEPS